MHQERLPNVFKTKTIKKNRERKRGTITAHCPWCAENSRMKCACTRRMHCLLNYDLKVAIKKMSYQPCSFAKTVPAVYASRLLPI